jgi:hypothetical protein
MKTIKIAETDFERLGRRAEQSEPIGQTIARILDRMDALDRSHDEAEAAYRRAIRGELNDTP